MDVLSWNLKNYKFIIFYVLDCVDTTGVIISYTTRLDGVEYDIYTAEDWVGCELAETHICSFVKSWKSIHSPASNLPDFFPDQMLITLIDKYWPF